MASTLDLYIDTGTGELVQAGASASGDLPTLTRNDSYTLRLRLLEKKADGTIGDIDATGATLKAAIGDIEAIPSDGDFKLICNGITSAAIPYNASAVSVYNAISNNVSTVSIYGNQYLLTATQPNTAMSFSADSFTLFPSSSVIVGTRRNPITGVNAQQTIRLQKDPAVFSDNFITSPTSGEIVLTKLSDGSSSQNETYELEVGAGILGGAFSLVFGSNATTSIAIGTNAVTVQAAISSGINTISSSMSVQENGRGGYIIAFTGRLGLTNIGTALTLDATGVDFAPFKQTTLTLNTAELADFFTNADADSITPTLEIELTQNGNPKTILQKSVTIRKDLITTGSFAPSTGQQFYNAAESDARFVSRIGDVGFYNSTPISKPASTNVVSALVSLGLIANTVTLNEQGGSFPTVALTGSAITVTDNIPFVFGTTNGSKLGTTTSQKLSFFGSTAIVQPASNNVVSALVNLGLIAASVTLGVTNNSMTFPTVALTGSAITVTDNIPFVFGTANGSKFGTATGQKISFYNSTPTVQPSSTNVTSALVSLGLIASSVTLGLPTNVVTDTTTNISATNRYLADSSSVTSVDYQNRVLKTSSGATAVNWQTGAFGVGTTVVTIASNNVSISGSYYIAMGTENGAFRTLSTTASIAFGSIANNSSTSVSVVVTGCAINDIVLLGLPSAISSGLSFIGHVTTANGLEVDAVNATNSTINQSTQTFRITVLNYA